MNVFELDRVMIEEYAAFSRSFTKIRAADIRDQIDSTYATRRYWPEPIVQINPHYKRDRSVADLVRDGVLHRSCDVVFRDWILRTHQVQSIHLARQKKSFVVTTGTGSGKSVCFFVPIIDAVLRARAVDPSRRTRAIVVYPMNALANSQVGELDRYFKDVVNPHRVTYKRYTGQESQDERRRIADNPPDILLTNFMMLELLLTRQEELDQRVVSNCEGLEFLVLDELHTYRGRQGADVAMLVRRLRERLAPGREVLCIGTSATMTSEGGEGAREVVADVASKLFAAKIHATDVVIETLERRTDPMQSAETVKPKLTAAIAAAIPDDATDAALKTNPLAIWAETTLGIVPEFENGPWVRATPSSLSSAAEMLAADSGVDNAECRKALERLLLVASRPEQHRAGRGNEDPFFGVRLHQFISGAGRAHSTMSPTASAKSPSTVRSFCRKARATSDSMLFISATTVGRSTCRFGTATTAAECALKHGRSRTFHWKRTTTGNGGSASSCRRLRTAWISAATPRTTPRRGRSARRTATSGSSLDTESSVTNGSMCDRQERSSSPATSRAGSNRAISGSAPPAANSPPRRVQTSTGSPACRLRGAVPRPPSSSPRS